MATTVQEKEFPTIAGWVLFELLIEGGGTATKFAVTVSFPVTATEVEAAPAFEIPVPVQPANA